MRISSATQTAKRRLFRPWANEYRRVVASRFRRDQTLVIDHFGEFRFRVGNHIEVARTLDYGSEPLALATLLFLLKPTDVVWDIGASIGLFTVHCAAKAGHVVAFEPDPSTAARLQQNIDLNGLHSKVEVRQAAVGESPGELELATDGLDGFAPALSIGKLGRHRNTVKVRVETVTQLVAAGVRAPDVLKVDIEGAEILALRGAAPLLRSPTAPRLLFIEVHPKFIPQFGASSDDVLKLVRDAGYQTIAAPPRDDQFHLIGVRPDRA